MVYIYSAVVTYDLSRIAAVPSGCTIGSFTLTQDGKVPASTCMSSGSLNVSSFESGEIDTLRCIGFGGGGGRILREEC